MIFSCRGGNHTRCLYNASPREALGHRPRAPARRHRHRRRRHGFVHDCRRRVRPDARVGARRRRRPQVRDHRRRRTLAARHRNDAHRRVARSSPARRAPRVLRLLRCLELFRVERAGRRQRARAGRDRPVRAAPGVGRDSCRRARSSWCGSADTSAFWRSSSGSSA